MWKETSELQKRARRPAHNCLEQKHQNEKEKERKRRGEERIKEETRRRGKTRQDEKKGEEKKRIRMGPAEREL